MKQAQEDGKKPYLFFYKTSTQTLFEAIILCNLKQN